MLAGHAALLPVHTSAASQPLPTDARHTVPLATPTSGRHAAELPVHTSAASQPLPTDARHTVPLATPTLAGHGALLPVHTSAASQPLFAEARHTDPAVNPTSVGHAAALPVQVSGASQPLFAEARHTVPVATPMSAGHAEPVPLQASAASQPLPEAGRHTVPEATLPQVVGPDALAVTLHTWQLLAGFSWLLEKQVPPMRQKPSSTRPLQSLSIPSQISALSDEHVGRVAVTTKGAHIVAPAERNRRTYAVPGHATEREA
jgi:hypothetical protein